MQVTGVKHRKFGTNSYLVLLHFHNLCLRYEEMNDQYYEDIQRTESEMQECVPILKYLA